MIPGDRVRLIQAIREQMLTMADEDHNLLLDVFGIGKMPYGASLTEWLNDQAGDAELIALGQHLEVLPNKAQPSGAAAASHDSEPEALLIFATHIAAHRGFLGEVKGALEKYSIRMFVAHDTIPMDAPWQLEIVEALNACQAGAMFIHPGLHDSFYCMQEAGWMLGRGIPLARLMFGDSPKGLLGDKQGKDLKHSSAFETAEAIVDWSTRHSSLEPNLATSLATAFKGSSNYDQTRQIWPRITTLKTLTPGQLLTLIQAAESNSQVYDANDGWNGSSFRRLVGRRALEEWGAEEELAARANKLLTESGYIIPVEHLQNSD